MNKVAYLDDGGPKGAKAANLVDLVNRASRSLRDLEQQMRIATDPQATDVSANRATVEFASEHCPADSYLQIDVRRARSLRLVRKRLLGPDMYSGPCWEILLHLFESHVFERRDSIGNVVDGADVPGSTTLRWLVRLEEEGMVFLMDDHLDRRRRYVELTAKAIDLLSNYFSGIAPHAMAA